MPLTESLRLKILWLFLAVSAFAAVEPSPYEAMFFVCLIAFARGGLAFDATLAPLIVSLFVFDAAGLIALIPYTGDSESVTFTFVSVYISLTTILFATVVAQNPLPRMKAIRSGYTFAAMLAAILGLLGYFNVAGLSPYFTLYDGGRASGPFKDPNVFAPFLVAPIGWVCQDLLLRRSSIPLSLLMLVVMLLAVFVSFSRGALIDSMLTLALTLGLTFITTTSAALKRRAVLSGVVIVVLIAALGAIVLSVPSIRDLALERATLTEDYDSGEQGRFGNQLRSIPMLLDRPLGFGPFRFAKYFPADPHEVFLSAFASFGWVGGIAFAVFVALTLYVGFVFAFRRSRVQTEFIGVFAAMLPQLLQGVQIDTMHWRHLFMLIGCLFGLAAAAHRESPAANARREALVRA
jgi:O-Antigen ligase